jgi:hypothetical protein
MMAEVEAGTKKCDRCGMFEGFPQTLHRMRDSDNVSEFSVKADLCSKCKPVVDNRIKRAVKPK